MTGYATTVGEACRLTSLLASFTVAVRTWPAATRVEELVEAQLGDVGARLPRLVEQHEREAHHDQGQRQLAWREATAAGRGRAFR